MLNKGCIPPFLLHKSADPDEDEHGELPHEHDVDEGRARVEGERRLVDQLGADGGDAEGEEPSTAKGANLVEVC